MEIGWVYDCDRCNFPGDLGALSSDPNEQDLENKGYAEYDPHADHSGQQGSLVAVYQKGLIESDYMTGIIHYMHNNSVLFTSMTIF